MKKSYLTGLSFICFLLASSLADSPNIYPSLVIGAIGGVIMGANLLIKK